MTQVFFTTIATKKNDIFLFPFLYQGLFLKREQSFDDSRFVTIGIPSDHMPSI